MKAENNFDLKNLSFKTTSFGINHDIVDDNDYFITEHEGIIIEVRIEKNQPPLTIGEYAFSVWNFKLARQMGVDLPELISGYWEQDSYVELSKNVDSYDLYDRMVVVQNLLIHPKYRKKGISEEFTEYVYRDFHSSTTLIVALVKPLQENNLDYDYYFKQKTIKFRELIKTSSPYRVLPASKYYGLSELAERDDSEMNHYKLFAVAKRCGFRRINDSFLFTLSPKMVEDRIKLKLKTKK